MRIALAALALTLVPVLASCGQTDAPLASAQAHEIAWREGDVDDALADLREAIYEYARRLRPLIAARFRAEAESRALEAQLALPAVVPPTSASRRKRSAEAAR